MTSQLLILFHVLGAIVWTGGHLVLALVVLPRALRAREPRLVHDFEQGYERLAVPALFVQVATGIALALRSKPPEVAWSDLATFPVPYVALKLVCLLAILALAVHAKRRVLPRLEAGDLATYSRHAWAVTLLSLALVVLGVGLTTGGY